MAEHVVLVDRDGAPIGVAPKLEAHERGVLHRAVSVMVFDGAGCVLLQRRALEKYHSGNLWSNTCCGHPRPGELALEAAQRRLHEEMGLATPLARAFTFRYREALSGGLTEHEIDHVFVGIGAEDPVPDESEVGDWAWVPLEMLEADLAAHPEQYTAWLPHLLRAMSRHTRETRAALAHARRRRGRSRQMEMSP